MIGILILFVIPPIISFFGARMFFQNEDEWTNKRMIAVVIASLVPVINWLMAFVVGIYMISHAWETVHFDKIREWLDDNSKI